MGKFENLFYTTTFGTLSEDDKQSQVIIDNLNAIRQRNADAHTNIQNLCSDLGIDPKHFRHSVVDENGNHQIVASNIPTSVDGYKAVLTPEQNKIGTVALAMPTNTSDNPFVDLNDNSVRRDVRDIWRQHTGDEIKDTPQFAISLGHIGEIFKSDKYQNAVNGIKALSEYLASRAEQQDRYKNWI